MVSCLVDFAVIFWSTSRGGSLQSYLRIDLAYDFLYLLNAKKKMSVVNVLSVIEREHSTPVMSVVDSIRLFIRNFGIAYGIRSGISVFLRAFHLATKEPSALLNLDKIFGEPHLQFRADAVRWGLFLGWATGGYCLVHGLLQKHFGVNSWNCMVSGAIAGLGAIAHGAEQRRTLALYSMARVFQCCYNEAKRRGIFTPLKHGDSLLFAIASAQIMYAYVMRPETLPLSYWNFIVRAGEHTQFWPRYLLVVRPDPEGGSGGGANEPARQGHRPRRCEGHCD